MEDLSSDEMFAKVWTTLTGGDLPCHLLTTIEGSLIRGKHLPLNVTRVNQTLADVLLNPMWHLQSALSKKIE